MTFWDRLLWLVFLIPPQLVPVLARAQPAGSPAGEIVVVEDGTPAPVAPDEVADRLRAELPDASIRVASPGEVPSAGTVTVALTASGTLQVVYRDAAGREATRILADTHDPSAVAAAVAMIVANLHRSQLDAVLGPPAPPVPALSPPAPPPSQPASALPGNVPVPDPAPAVRRPPSTGAPAGPPPPAARGLVADVGGLYAVVAASAVVGLGYDLSAVTRLGVRANAAYLPMDESMAFTLDFFYTRLGRNRPGRFDFGAQGGLLAVNDGETLGAHLGPFASYLYALGPSASLGLRLGVDVALIEGEATLWPNAALFFELPL